MRDSELLLLLGAAAIGIYLFSPELRKAGAALQKTATYSTAGSPSIDQFINAGPVAGPLMVSQPLYGVFNAVKSALGKVFPW